MLRSLSLPVVALAAAATLSSSLPASACSEMPSDTGGRVTFSGRTVPRNAELWITGPDYFVGPDSALFLIAPDGRELVAEIETDLDSARVLSPEPLTPGAWIFRSRDVYEGETYDNDYPFQVSDADDVDAPAAPTVTVTIREIGGMPFQEFYDPCSPRERTTIRTISIDVDDDVVRAIVDGVHHNASGGQVMVANRQEDGSDVVVSVFDFAGNESEVVVASPVAADGCASVPASTSLLAALLLLVRRRRSA